MAERDRGLGHAPVALTETRLSRRKLVKGSAVLGLGVPTFLSLLAACAEDDDDPIDEDPEASAEDEAEDEEDPIEDPDDDPDVDADTDDEDADVDESDDAMTSEEAPGEGQYGGQLEVAMSGDLLTLDMHLVSATALNLVGWNMYETLFTWDSEYASIPLLAESHDVSDDGLVHTIQLRQGVMFHNGEEMTASDVLASIERWAEGYAYAEGLLEATDDLVEVDDYTIEFQLNQPFGTLTSALSQVSRGAAIYPRSVIEASEDDELLSDYVGTGPYRFVEWQRDVELVLERFEDYSAIEGEPDGYGGHRHAYLDSMRFVPVPDEAARLAGMTAGDFHLLETVPSDQFETMQDDPNINAETLPPIGCSVFIVNHSSPITENLLIRQAIQAALDMESILQAGFGEGFYRLDPGLMSLETVWHSEAGAEFYNQADPDRARELLEEAGYDGEEIRWTCTQEYSDHYNRSVVAVQQLEDIGMNIDLIVRDWATILDEQSDPDAWEVTATGVTLRADPEGLFLLNVCDVAGWWCDEETMDLVNQLRTESDFDTRYEIWEQIQFNVYDQVPFIKNGDTLELQVTASSVHGLSPQVMFGPALWNVWLDD